MIKEVLKQLINVRHVVNHISRVIIKLEIIPIYLLHIEVHKTCNLNLRLTKRVLATFHNLGGNDSHLTMQKI